MKSIVNFPLKRVYRTSSNLSNFNFSSISIFNVIVPVSIAFTISFPALRTEFSLILSKHSRVLHIWAVTPLLRYHSLMLLGKVIAGSATVIATSSSVIIIIADSNTVFFFLVCFSVILSFLPSFFFRQFHHSMPKFVIIKTFFIESLRNRPFFFHVHCCDF